MTLTRPMGLPLARALVLVAITGCQLDIDLGDPDDPSTTGSTGQGAGASSSSGAPGSDDTGSPGSDGTPDTGAPGDTETQGDTEPTATCLPPPEDVVIQVFVDVPTVMRDPFYATIDAACVVQGVMEDGDRRTYPLECDEGGEPVPRVLEVLRSPGPIELPVAAGTPVHLQLVQDFPIDYGGFRYIVVRDAAGELLLGAYGGGLVPESAGIDVDEWFAPLTYALAFGDCEPEPYEDPGGSFIVEPCPAARTRLALDFQLGDASIHLLEGTSGPLGPLVLEVTSARHLDPVGECDFPLDAFSFVAHRAGA